MFFSADQSKVQKIIIAVALLLVGVGILFRFTSVTQNDFVFYDEGYYLNYNRLVGEIIDAGYVNDFGEFLKALNTYIRSSLGSGKALWFLLVDARILFGAMENWFVPRFAAAVAGFLTLFLVYRFANRFYNSRWAGWLSVGLLAILPSHVFYSRIGMQETLSTLLLLAGFYFYLFPRRFSPRTFVAGLFFAASFFANYRLIILPVLVAFCEGWDSFSYKEKPNFRKYVWCILTFAFVVVIVGNFYDGRNAIVTFSWMFHQANLAGEHFDPMNLLSYPYYIFRLENGIFGVFFFANIYLLSKKKVNVLFPFVLVCLYMLIFSFPSEKGARYLCVMTPFLVMSVAHLIEYLFQEMKNSGFRIGLTLCVVLMSGLMVTKAFAISRIKSDYRKSAEFLMAEDRNIKFLSTQNYVQNLYVPKKKNVAAPPVAFPHLLKMNDAGFQYLVVGPQAYISWTEKEKRFHSQLRGYLGFIVGNIRPLKTFEHFSPVMMERFVLEHNENLNRSINFLKISRERGFGKLRVYDLNQTIPVILKAIGRTQKE